MNLPRVVIDVVRRKPGPGWTVAVTGDGIEEYFTLDTVTVDVGGRELTLPHRGDCDAALLAGRLARIDDRATLAGDVYAYGEWLFHSLLEPVWCEIRKLPAVVAARGVELALRWPVDDTELHQLTWEAMCHEGIPLANDPDLLVAITRLVPVKTGEVQTIERTPKVLFAVGGALLDDTIRPGAMFMGLVRAFDADGVCAAKVAQSVDSDELGRHCAEFRPDVVHLVAHGDVVDGHGKLKLAKGEWAGADVLVPAMTRTSRPLAVVLSACRTGSGGLAEPTPAGPLAAELVAAGIPIVSAVAGEVSEQACRLYSRRLVEAISDGTPLAKAVAQGRRAALSRTEPGQQLDWAMPALFVSESVDPAFRPVNRDSAEVLVNAARQLQLRVPPVFIGRDAILGHVDDMFDRRNPLGVIGAIREGTLEGLGGTRLLQEMGYQLLMRGHLPVLLGPYGLGAEPADLRRFLSEIYEKLKDLAKELVLTLPRFEMLDYPAADDPSRQARLRGHIVALDDFRGGTGKLSPSLAREVLAADFAKLVTEASGLNAPFGEHTRVVVLADELHRWPFVNELEPWLDKASALGLGSDGHAAPFVFTASAQEGCGLTLKSLSDRKYGQPGYAFPPLDKLEADEALLGFQWILLNPWIKGDEKCRKVYAARPDADWEFVRSAFEILDGKPALVRERVFYKVAHMLLLSRSFVADDDFATWDRFLGLDR